MQAGIYHGLSFAEYRDIDAMSQSVLKLMDRDEKYGASPLHAKASLDGLLVRDSNAQSLGRAEHAWILEGEQAFREQFLVAAPGCCMELKTGERKGEPCGATPSLVDADGSWFCRKHKRDWMTEPDNSVTAADLERIKAMAESVRGSEINAHLSRPGGSSEATIVHEVQVDTSVQACPECGGDPRKRGFEDWVCSCGASFTAPKVESVTQSMRMKCRLDRLLQPHRRFPHMVVDLKRHGGDWGEWEIRNAVKKYGYDVQAAAYTEAVRMHYGVDACDYVWIFVEPTFPHDVFWKLASEDDLKIGADKLDRYRREWVACEHRGRWPGILKGFQAGALPDNYVRDYFKRESA